MSDKEKSGSTKGTLAIWFVAALFLALSPIGQEPHLWQKLKLLWHGWLQKPVDWFDLLMHGVPITAWAAYVIYLALKRRAAD
ncbi:MAG: RND transporter [Spirochaetaceae bacterium]|nr:RND transporter [Spirochaetaceae bacterium]|tara:strand:+ start:39732 stop:39977 length:246 start_codon:yes stop_codon:yes gene_type:complete